MAKLSMKMPELTRPVNILVLGLKVLSSDLHGHPHKEQGYDVWQNSFKGLTDTMLLVRFDPQNKKLSVLSIPRDTRTYVEGRGVVKINEANYYSGPASSAKSVSGLLGGVGIDRYVTVNIQGIKSLVDALGGITINVPKDMKYTDESQHLYIDLKAGKQNLNGEQIVQYLLYRHDDLGDIGRVQRQQLLMRAFVEQEVNVGLLSRLPKILSVIQSHLDTNLSIEELVALAGFATKTDRAGVQMLMVPGRFSDSKDYKASFWLPDQDAIETLMAKHFDFGQNTWQIENADSTFLKVAIQDSTGDSSAVEDFVNTLSRAGYRNVQVYKASPNRWR